MFIDDVQQWLTAPKKVEGLPPLPEGFDIEGRREVVWRALEELELEVPEDQWKLHRGALYSDWRRRVEFWTTPHRVERWLVAFLPPFLAGVGKRLSPGERVKAVDHQLREWVTESAGPDFVWSRTVGMEMGRLGKAAMETISDDSTLETNNPGRWCRENLITDSGGVITSCGRALCELTGRDAVEFALSLGVELSVGPDDPWRLGAAGLLAVAKELQEYHEDPDAPSSRYSKEAMVRLAFMGVAVQNDENIFTEFVCLHDDARDLVLRVATEPDSRFRALARTLIDLERGRVTTQATGRPYNDLSDMNYARSVAHEIRNKMLPLSTALGSLWDELGQDQPDFERRQKLRERIDRSLNNLNEFANDAVRLSAAVQAEELALADVVTEAVKATESERNGRIAVVITELVGLKIVGARRDWASAIANMLRNSAQVRAGKGSVWISTQRDDTGGLHLYVDDDGPGVPEEARERVFDDGFSTNGGSGVGLALARRAAQLSGGTLTCQESPRGGCRFHFALPRRSVR